MWYYPTNVWFVFEDELRRVRALIRMKGQGYIWHNNRNGWVEVSDDTIVQYFSRNRTGVYDRECTVRQIMVYDEDHFRKLYQFYNAIV